MAPVVKVRQFLASKAGGNGPGTDAKVLTPLQRLKLKSRTASPTTGATTPGRVRPGAGLELESSRATRPAAEASTAPAAHERQGQLPGDRQAQEDIQAVQLKLTLLQVPLMPKTEVYRPAPPSNTKALLQRLHDLRTAGDGLVAAADADLAAGDSHGSSAGPSAIPLAGAGAAPSPSPARSRWLPLQPAAATPGGPHGSFLGLRPPARPGHGGTPAAASAAAVTHYPQLRTPHATRPASPYTGGVAAFGSGAGAQQQQQPPPCVSPPSMAGLRQRELQETGGGFLTRFADPRDLATPQPTATALRGGGRSLVGGTHAGGGGAGGGGSAPLSVLRSIHRLQQLQRLQREGAQLVAAMGVS